MILISKIGLAHNLLMTMYDITMKAKLSFGKGKSNGAKVCLMGNKKKLLLRFGYLVIL